MINIKNNQAGQSLMEMLIAIFILIVALTATIVLVVTSINAGRDSINKLAATNLAREGIEVVRNIRDGNWVDPSGTITWDDGLGVGIGPMAIPTIVAFAIDDNPTELSNSTNGFNDSKAEIYYSPSLGYYYQNVDSLFTPSDQKEVNFFRVIYLNDICQNDASTEEIVSLGSSDDCTSFGTGSDYLKVGVRVVSEVRWPNSNSRKKVQVEERLYNWQSL